MSARGTVQLSKRLHRQQRRSTGLGVPLGLIAALALLLVPFRGFESLDREWVIWGTAIVLIALPVTAYLNANRNERNPWLDPVFLITAFFGFKYGFGALAANYWSALSWQGIPGAAATFERWGIWENLPASCHLFLLAGLGLYIGVSLPPPRILDTVPALRWRIDMQRFRLNLYLYTPLAMALFLVGRGFLPLVIRDSVLLLAWITWVVIVIAAAESFGRDQTDRGAWSGIIVIIFLGQVAMGLVVGMRGAFVYPLLLVGAGYAMARGRLPWVTVSLLGGALILIIVPWLTFYKLQSVEMPIVDRVRAASEEMSTTTVHGLLDNGIVAFIGRPVGIVGMTALFIQDVPDRSPFEYGGTFLVELIHIVPRIIWPEKPNMSAQLNVYSRRAGIVDLEDETTSAVFDAVSEYYVNFGVIGVFVLSVLHGYYLRTLHRWLVERSLLVIGAPMFLVFILINFDFFGVVNTILSHTRQIPVWGLAFYVLSRDTRPVAT